MLKTLAILLLVAFCVGGCPTEWASRIVYFPSKNNTLTFYGTAPAEIDPTFTLYPMPAGATPFNVTFKNAKCQLDNSSIWSGGDCNYTDRSEGKPGKAMITVYNITLWDKLTYSATYSGVNGTIDLLVYFDPYGKHEEPQAGNVIILESAPLTHFVKNGITDELKFGVWGYDRDESKPIVTLAKNGVTICKWTGKTADPNLNCGNMTRDENHTMTFAMDYKKPLNADFYVWTVDKMTGNFVTVVVDSTQSGSAVTYMLQVISGLLATLLYLRQ